MGCHFSAATGDGGDGTNRTFRVYNVDSQGIELNPGKIQVAASDLILYQRGKEPIRWPLRCLRRYGFDAELFSFESGRRCPTGPGIYAFKCRYAENLFNMVQESIQRAGQEDHMRASGGGGSGSGSGTGSHGIFTHAGRSGGQHTSMVEPPEPCRFVLSSNGGNSPHLNFDTSSQQHLYINGSLDAGHRYVNTGIGGRGAIRGLDESAPVIGFLTQPGRGQVNYAVLDLPSSMENLLDDTGQGAVHNFPRTGSTSNRHSMPGDLTAMGMDEGMMVAGDSDVFLADPVMATYINVNVDEPSPPMARYYNTFPGEELSMASGAGGSAKLGVDSTQCPLHNPASVQSPNRAPPAPCTGGRQQKPGEVNYIQLDLNQAPTDSAGPAGSSNMSPTSPTSMMSVPESPACGSYATIDFNKTEALSHSTRGGADGEDEPGARKTRHNSTIGT